ncbi:MAG: hypothetical protein ACYTKD_06295 [Planctomycetota bacterium]|jgi:hypothetical protein
MRETKRFLVAVAAGAVVLAVVWVVLIGPARTDAQAEAREAEIEAEKRARFYPGNGAPITDVEKALAGEEDILEKLKGELGRLKLAIPPELEAADGRDTLYFQQQLAKLRAKAESSVITFEDKAAPFGFSNPPQDDQIEEYLARLEVASRFLNAAKAAGLAGVIRAEQPAPGDGPAGGGRRAHELPMKVIAAADEKSLILLLHQISRPEQFLALKGLEVEVKDESSGHFEAMIELAGVTVVKDEGPIEPAPGEPDGGTNGRGPRRSFRRYRP